VTIPRSFDYSSKARNRHTPSSFAHASLMAVQARNLIPREKYKTELPHEPRPQPVKNTIKGKSL
jgi:hypothetical protein